MSEYDRGEMGRQLANLVRVGKIAELDEANARVKVSTAGLTTDWLPWGAARAGKTRQWSPPQVGEQVVIASPYGDMAQAVVIGSLFQDDSPAPAASKDQETTVYPDGARQDYNSASHTFTLEVPAGGKIVFKIGATTLELRADGTTLTTPQFEGVQS